MNHPAHTNLMEPMISSSSGLRRDDEKRSWKSFLIKLIAFALLLSASSLLQAAVTARLETNTIYSGDTVTLRITTSGDDQGVEPDLAPLEKDFDVLGSSSNRQVQIINGKRTDKHEWLYQLAPLREGSLTVPPLTVGNSSTAALSLQVSEQPAAVTAQAGESAFIRAEINPVDTDTYVQQQILYTTRLYYRIPLIEGSFSDPQVDHAVTERLGEDKQYKTTIDGQNYQVVERRYAIFPERSGELHIGPAVFTGRTVAATNQRSGFNRMDSMMQRMLSQNGFNDRFFAGTPFGNPGKRIRLGGEAITLDIQPRPNSYNGANWLPTQKLVLRDSWAEAPPIIRAGEPVTRTLTLEAHGLEASQLPDIIATESSHLRIYPEQPALSNRTDGDWIYGRSEQHFTYVASQTGKIELPEIRIDWWDSVNHQPQTTLLPAWEVMVEAGSGEPTATIATSETVQPVVTADNTPASDPLGQIPLPWKIGGAMAALAILATFLRIRRSSTTNKPETLSGRTTTNAENAGTSLDSVARIRTRNALHDACARADTQAAAGALLDWAATTWPHNPPRSLGALAERVDQGAAAIRELDSALYGAADSGWISQPLWKAFMDGLRAEAPSSPNGHQPDGAPPLYPDWSQKAG